MDCSGRNHGGGARSEQATKRPRAGGERDIEQRPSRAGTLVHPKRPRVAQRVVALRWCTAPGDLTTAAFAGEGDPWLAVIAAG
jgi:hypothetical protein